MDDTVAGVSCPVGCRPRFCWNCSTARSVLWPQTPSTPPGVETQAAQAVLKGADRAGLQSVRWGHRRRKCRLLSAQEDRRVKAECRGGRLVQLTRHLQLVAGLKLLQCGGTVRSPNAVGGSAVGARATQMILNRLHRSRSHGLHIGQGGDGLSDCRWAE